MLPESLTGRTLGHFHLLERIGAGGMGEVYTARDEMLGRTVAVKILPPAFAESPERLARFEREARIASSLSHPHIATVYETGEAEGFHFIAMEYVEGLSLSAWIEARRPGLPQILRAMEQVGDALARAHASGILHRDLKPANVMMTREDRAKLLDFGLAKAAGESDAGPDAETQERLTRTGVVMGTMAYMSPEQAKSHPMDRRSDVFSLGTVLFEAVAGIHPFPSGGGLEAATGVLRDDPIPALRKRGLPPELVRVLAKTLEKEPARRYQYMDDLVVDLRELRQRLESGPAEQDVASFWARARWWQALVGGVIAGLALAGAAVGISLRSAAVAPPLPVARPGVRSRPLTFSGLNRDPWLSAQGDRVCYASDRFGSFDIVLQDLATGRVVRVTEDPGDEIEPSLSPDGQTIVYATADGKIQTVPALGGAVRTLAAGGADVPNWSPDGQLVAFRRGELLYLVARTGGDPQQVSPRLAFPVSSRPAWSPDGRWLAFPSNQEGRYVLARIPTSGGPASVIGRDVQALGRPFWSADGRWIVGSMGPPRDFPGEIWSVAVSASMDAVGDPLRIRGGVDVYQNPSLSRDGRKMAFEVLDLKTYVARIPTRSREPLAQPMRLDVDARFYGVAVSNDGSTIAVITDRPGRQALWRMPAGGGPLEPLHEGPGDDENPAWSPDDRSIALSHIEEGKRRLAVMASSGGPLTLLSEPQRFAWQPAWSPDGRAIAFLDRSARSLCVIPAGGGASRALATVAQDFDRLSWSPDGRWIAVGAGAGKGTWSIVAASVAGGPPREIISNARAPLWLSDGRIVFLRETRPGTLDLWSADVGPDGAAKAGGQVALTRLPRGQTIDGEGATTDGGFLYVTLVERGRDDVWISEAP